MNDLVVIEKSQAMDIFTKPEQLMPLLERISIEVKSVVPDLTTAKGRKEIASNAYRVAQSKTYIENFGKEIAAELKELPKIVDRNRKIARDFLDALRDEIRSPLDAWEAQKAAIELQTTISVCYDEAILMNEQFDIARKAMIEKQEQEKRELLERMQRQAEEKARIDAERKFQFEIAEAKRKEEQAQQELERQIRLNQEREKRDIKEAERENALKQRQIEMAVLEEKARQEAIQQQLRQEEQRKRLDAENRFAVHARILSSLVILTDITEEMALSVLNALISEKIHNVKIIY